MTPGAVVAVAFFVVVACSWVWLAWEFVHAPELDDFERPARDRFAMQLASSMDDGEPGPPAERRRG